MRRLVLGTRGSELARAQTSLVQAALRGVETEIEIITTRGDGQLSAAGRKGLFTAEIEHALLERRVDVAVHSAKDLPSDATPGLEVCAALPRAAVDDVLVARTAPDVNALPAGATVATGSVRRQHQLHWSRPDLIVVDLRGNVPTRLRKLNASSWDAIILARAGLERLGYDCSRGEINFEGETFPVAVLPNEQFLPAGGQGIVALQIRSDDTEARQTMSEVNHGETFFCLRAEREFLRLLEGDCGTPVGVLGTISGGAIRLRAQVFANAESAPRVAEVEALVAEQQPELVATSLFERMYGDKK